MRVRVKICGITRPQDAEVAAAAGADAIGLNFSSQSPRCVTLEQASLIAARVPPFVTIVGLFVNTERAAIERILAAVPLGLLQFNGEEQAAHCESFGVPYVKAVRVRERIDTARWRACHPRATGLLLDAYVPGRAGGTGATFDWDLWPETCEVPLLLAGGLTPANVGAAVRRLHPYGVDVASGVESSPGVKDADRLEAFVREVQRATEGH